MHDLLRDMGREIIRSKTPMEPEERSRLWFHEDALDVLSKETVRLPSIIFFNLKYPKLMDTTNTFMSQFLIFICAIDWF